IFSDMHLLSYHHKSCPKFCNLLRRLSRCTYGSRATATASREPKTEAEMKSIRNVGIIAHIDAGKTTTTERMLYYSGQTSTMGEVHDGDTVMDYLDQERERGITITSASITFDWRKHRINLIDTPGHVDFTVEVERALSVLDGAVAILDASAGVEAQTVTVWSQADRYRIPRILYLNKMDKSSAKLEDCVTSVERKLGVKPIPIHMPLGSGKGFNGVIDLVTLERHVWSPLSDTDGKVYDTSPLQSSDDLYAKAQHLREELIGSISDLDDKLSEEILNTNQIEDISVQSVQNALRRVTIKQLGYPLLCGSSYKNTGVQLLMDSICRYFPSPLEKVRQTQALYSGQLCAFAFKIVFHKRLGCLTFLRLYSGDLKATQTMFNVNRDKPEKIHKIYMAFADDFREVSHLSCGNIAVVTGLSHTITGDTLVTSQSVANDVKRKSGKESEPIFGGLSVPEPVFYCSIESPSLSKLKDMELALTNLQREDPSFQVFPDKDSGQTVIKGMGELHIEVIKDRILREYGVDAHLGPLQVSYRETIAGTAVETLEIDKIIGGTKNRITIALQLSPKSKKQWPTDQLVRVVVTKENELGSIRSDRLKAIETGVQNALDFGPLLSFPVMDVSVDLLSFQTTFKTTIPMIISTASQCVTNCLKKASPQLLEPYMSLEVTTPDRYIGAIISDLSQRRSQIGDMTSKGDLRVVNAITPLSDLMDYSTFVRTVTSGTASFCMHFESYRHMSDTDQHKAIHTTTERMNWSQPSSLLDISFNEVLDSCTKCVHKRKLDNFALRKYWQSISELPVTLKCRLIQSLSQRRLLSDENISYLINNELIRLDLNDCLKSDFTVNLIRRHCSRLRYLDLGARIANFNMISAPALTPLFPACNQLQQIRLSNCIEVNDQVVDSMVHNCHRLEVLQLCGCSITDRAAKLIGDNCPNLQSVDMSRTVVSDDGLCYFASSVCAKSVAELMVNNCSHVTATSVRLISECCPKLSIFCFQGTRATMESFYQVIARPLNIQFDVPFN
ncbi:unnamed protein product, partial [Medioppia subpectinata]